MMRRQRRKRPVPARKRDVFWLCVEAWALAGGAMALLGVCLYVISILRPDSMLVGAYSLTKAMIGLLCPVFGAIVGAVLSPTVMHALEGRNRHRVRSSLRGTVVLVLVAGPLAAVHPWLPLAVLPAWILYYLVLAATLPRVISEGRCQVCGYDLTGNESGRCPECGTAFGSAMKPA